MSTGASKGLQKALARAGGSVLAIAEMQASDLLAEMTDEQKAAMAAELAPSATAGAPKGTPATAAASDDAGNGEDDASKKEDGKDKKKGEEDDEDAPPPAAAAKADARVKAVAKAVAEDENCKGKAAAALAMLADDDLVSLSANGIIKVLAQQPNPTASAADAETAARAEMQAAIAASGNSNIELGDGGKPDPKAQADAVWNRAYGLDKEGAK